MSPPEVDSRYRYAHTVGLGAHHAELSAEMTELDMAPGTEVIVHDVDQERGGLVLLEWVDRPGNPRMTSVDPQLFGQLFEAVTGGD